LGTGREYILKIGHPAKESFKTDSKPIHDLPGAPSGRPSLPKGHNHHHDTGPIHMTAPVDARWRQCPAPASRTATTKTLADKMFFGNSFRCAPCLALIIGLVERPSTVWAPAPALLPGELYVDEVKKIKKVGLFKKFW